VVEELLSVSGRSEMGAMRHAVLDKMRQAEDIGNFWIGLRHKHKVSP
jgi:hypothetical protein